MKEIKELVGSTENFGGAIGVHAFGKPKPGDYLMLQAQDLNIPFLLGINPLVATVDVNAQVAGKWQRKISAAVPRLKNGELLEFELRFSDDGGEVWISNTLYLHYPMAMPASSARKVFGTASFTYAGIKQITSLAPLNYGHVLNSLENVRAPVKQTKLVYDIGMGDGTDTDFFLRKGFNVVATEPNATAVAIAARRFADHLARGKLTILNMAIALDRGVAPFYVNTVVPSWSSANRKIAGRAHGITELNVPTVPLSDIIKTFGTGYYLKISTEGFDHIALSSLSKIKDKPKYVSTMDLNENIFKILKELGYKKMKLIKVKSIPSAQSPRPAKEGLTIEYKFSATSSGLFGEETPGNWKSDTQVRLDYLDHLQKDKKQASPDFEPVMLHAALVT